MQLINIVDSQHQRVIICPRQMNYTNIHMALV